MNISVIGTGYVGLVTGACFAEFGIHVTCVDNVAAKVERLEAGEIPIFEPGLEEIVRRNVQSGRLSFTTDAERAVQNSLVIFIAVPTPQSSDGSTDLSYVDQVARTIGAHLDGYKVVVTKSTVPVKTAERVKRIIAEAAAAAGNADARFSVASNPEFLREGSAVEDFLRPDRVVVGAEDPEAIAILRDLYKPLNLIEIPFVITNVATAELIKYASNAFLATKISFINEISALCEATGADVHDVSRAMGLDGRIGRKFLHPGPGYGGSCFPKDTLSLVQFSREFGVEQRIVSATVAANDATRARMVAKVEKMTGGVAGKTLGVLGLSFKPNTDDVRESPAIWVIKELQKRGAHVRCFDPQAMETAARELEGVTFCADAYDTAKGCDALLFLTEWNQFRKLDLALLKERLRQPVIVDMRNVCEPAEMKRLGFRYSGVGR
jgi:UDPglucose 6-dehydrogenase